MGTWYERLTQKREEIGLKKAQFAREVGVSSPTVTDWENGVMRPNGDNLLKIARVLKTTPEWLMTGKGDEEKKYPEPEISESEQLLLSKWASLLPGQRQEMMAVITEKADYAESVRQEVKAEEARKTKLRVVKVGGDEKEKPAPQQPKKQPGRVQLKDRAPEDEPTYITRLITRAEADRRKLAIAVEHDRRQAERDRRQLETEDQDDE